MAEEEKTAFESTKDDILKELKGKDKELMENVVLLFEAHIADLEDALDDIGDENTRLRLKVSEALNHHAWKIVVGYAGFAVALGRKTETIDENGRPTKKMTESQAEALAQLNEEFAIFKERFEELHPDAIDEDEDDEEEGDE